MTPDQETQKEVRTVLVDKLATVRGQFWAMATKSEESTVRSEELSEHWLCLHPQELSGQILLLFSEIS